MPIFQTGAYQIKPSGVGKVQQAIEKFVRHVQEDEPGTEMYLAWQEQGDPTKLLHLFIFADEEAQRRHGQSDVVREFEAAYTPELVGGPVVFTDYDMVAGKRDSGAQSKSAKVLDTTPA